MRSEDEKETVTVTICREQREWLREMAAITGESEDALVCQALQILRRASSYRIAASRFASRFARPSQGIFNRREPAFRTGIRRITRRLTREFFEQGWRGCRDADAPLRRYATGRKGLSHRLPAEVFDLVLAADRERHTAAIARAA
jgi:hypothetical protein